MATVDVGERGQMYKGEECRGQPMRKANTLWNVSRIEAKIRSHVAKTLLARNGNEASIPTVSLTVRLIGGKLTCDFGERY